MHLYFSTIMVNTALENCSNYFSFVQYNVSLDMEMNEIVTLSLQIVSVLVI